MAIVFNGAAREVCEEDVSPDVQELFRDVLAHVRWAWYGELGLAYSRFPKAEIQKNPKRYAKLRERLSRYFDAHWIMARASFPRGEGDPKRYAQPPEENWPHIKLFRSQEVLWLLFFLNRLLDGQEVTMAERARASAVLQVLSDACDAASSRACC